MTFLLSPVSSHVLLTCKAQLTNFLDSLWEKKRLQKRMKTFIDMKL